MSTQSHIDKVNLKPNLMEYPHHVGAPKIVPDDLTSFKNNGVYKVNKILDAKYKELIKQAEDLRNSFIINREVYESSYRFEPIIGEIYHLYENENGTKFLSIIEPTYWDKKHCYSARLNSDMTWTKLD